MKRRKTGERDVRGIDAGRLVAGGSAASGIAAYPQVVAHPREALLAMQRRCNDLAKSKRELEVAFDSVPGILVVCSSGGSIVHWNAAAHRAFGLSFYEVHGRQFSDCGIQWLEPLSTIDALFEGQEPDRRSQHPFERNGAKRWLGLTVHVVMQDDGDAGYLLSAADITVRLEAEERNQQTHKLEAIGQLAAGIAHEINTPTQYVGDNITFLREAWDSLQGVMEASQKLRGHVTAQQVPVSVLGSYDAAVDVAGVDFVLPEFPRALEGALEGTQRIAHIVRAMKEFSHPGSKDKTETDLNRMVENTLVIAKNEWKYVAEAVTELDAALPVVACYPGEIGQVILNLLVNAAHAIEEKQKREQSTEPGKITICTRQDVSWVEVLISDTGVGVPEAIKARIFELFFTTKEVGKGTGQGLAFAHSVVVKKHGGELWVDSESGRGSTFGFRLPLGQSKPTRASGMHPVRP